jgi:Uma2 family endonuclease
MMTATIPTTPDAIDGQFMTAEAYLDMERHGIREFHGKYELFNQTLRFMAGASKAHNDIAANILALLKWFTWQNDLNAHVAQSDMRVVSYLTYKNYFYPDIVFTEGERVYHDRKKDVLVNPTMLFEVLSDDTEDFDRGDKYWSYQQIESLLE